MVDLSPVAPLPPAAPVETLRPLETAPSAVRVTPLASGDGANADPRSRTSQENAELQSSGRVAFTAKIGPDPVTGVPLTVVRGAEVEAAEKVDLEAILDRKLSDGSDPRARAEGLREALGPGEAAAPSSTAKPAGEAEANLPNGAELSPVLQQRSISRGSVVDVSI